MLNRSRYRPGVAQRVGRGIAVLFHDRGTRRGWVVSSTPRPHFTPEKDPVPILQEAGWVPGPVWTGGGNLVSTGIRSRTFLPVVCCYTDWASGPNLHTIYPMLLSDFNGPGILLTSFRKVRKYGISWKFFLWEPSSFMRKNGRTDITDLVVFFRSFVIKPISTHYSILRLFTLHPRIRGITFYSFGVRAPPPSGPWPHHSWKF